MTRLLSPESAVIDLVARKLGIDLRTLVRRRKDSRLTAARGRTNTAASLGLQMVRALCAETHETWLEDNRYTNIALLKEQRKAAMKIAA